MEPQAPPPELATNTAASAFLQLHRERIMPASAHASSAPSRWLYYPAKDFGVNIPAGMCTGKVYCHDKQLGSVLQVASAIPLRSVEVVDSTMC